MKDVPPAARYLLAMTSLLLATCCQPAGPHPATSAASVERSAAASGATAAVERRIASHDHPSTQAERDETPLARDPDRVLYLVRPHDTDHAIDRFLQDHYVMYDRAVPQNGRLFLFFPGTFGRPRDYQLLLDDVARQGYRVIGLEYPDDTEDPAASTVGQICRRDPDPSCAGDVREERLTGRNSSSRLAVTSANSIVNRLLKLLSYLQRQHPDEHWDTFLLGGQIRWSRIVVGGHSQGSGFAAFIAKKHAVARVALWSGPNDHSRLAHIPATWMTSASATPLSSYYGMVHQQESAGQGPLTGWSVLGLSHFGPPVVATSNSSPYHGSHELVVTLPTRSGATTRKAYHRSTATDDATPLDGGHRPAYHSEWEYLVG